MGIGKGGEFSTGETAVSMMASGKRTRLMAVVG